MEVRIRECSRGGYEVEKGIPIEPKPNPFGGPGFLMKGFNVYESCHADTLKEAKRIAGRMEK